ncbi:TetR/AcrR family transcriptional regulator [Streptomyces europaeiscabiei]|uniref:TetR/AcrR family transcriptional regulator n=1 Tax=Streptomyces europaeiscabiei TaxID=146819 RepID=A0AAJ2PMF0_9ACTN|nr:TetR/AcrR family transcriptional regulator [Streptomyces europaeiscabiei]MDX3130060.1 TetR/AcrR family transcriptional regulator [Streptomyces europaeiscabiei]
MRQTEGEKQDGRTRNAQANRDRVYTAAIKVFAARGYDAATMDEIAAQAGVSRRTAFNHFPAKSDIATEWAVRGGESAFALVRDVDRITSAADRVRAYFHELALTAELNWDETRQMTTGLLRGYGVSPHRSQLSPELRDWLRDCLQEQPGNTPTPSADPALAVDVLYDVFQGAVMRWLPQEAAPHGMFTAEVDTAIALVLAGFGSDADHA